MGSKNMVHLMSSVLLSLCVIVNSDIVDVGYPMGFHPICLKTSGVETTMTQEGPGLSKPAKLKPESLKKNLFISVLGAGPVLSANWTRYNYHEIELLAKHPDIDFDKKTFMYVGGYLDSIMLPIGRTYGEVYRKMGFNVLILDYFAYAANDYPIASRLMRPVGRHAAEMLAKLSNLGLNPKKLELVGLSLGGHTMSFIAKHYREITGRNISTLIGLDPAGACFRHLGPEDRLDPSDADFVVDVITNSEGYGMATPLGHVSFYVNGGEYQLGEIQKLRCTIECSHMKVIMIWYAALLNPSSFVGILCDSVQQARDANCYDRIPMVTNIMGVNVDRSKPGIYYVPTFGKFPFAVGKKGLKKENRLAVKHVKSFRELQLL